MDFGMANFTNKNVILALNDLDLKNLLSEVTFKTNIIGVCVNAAGCHLPQTEDCIVSPTLRRATQKHPLVRFLKKNLQLDFSYFNVVQFQVIG